MKLRCFLIAICVFCFTKGFGATFLNMKVLFHTMPPCISRPVVYFFFALCPVDLWEVPGRVDEATTCFIYTFPLSSFYVIPDHVSFYVSGILPNFLIGIPFADWQLWPSCAPPPHWHAHGYGWAVSMKLLLLKHSSKFNHTLFENFKSMNALQVVGDQGIP